MRVFDYYWMSNPAWWHRKDNYVPVINEDAPEEAQESYRRYIEQKKKAQEEIDSGLSMD